MTSLRQLLLALAMLPLSGFAAPISLQTDSTELRLDVAGDKVNATYFGDRLRDSADASTGGAAFYPSHWDAYTGPHAIAITQPDGQLALDPVYVSHAVTEPAPGQKLLRVELKDRRYPVGLTLCVLAHKSSNVFERWVEVTNKGAKPFVIEKAASAMLNFKADKYFVTTFPGTWGAEMTAREQEVFRGNNLGVHSNATPKGAAGGSPTFLLSLNKPASETAGEVVLGTLAWSGNWAFQFENDYGSNSLDVTLGYDNAYAAYTLDAGKTFATPRIILTRSGHGAGEASRNMHRWARDGGMRGGYDTRKILLNSWEGAYFKFDEKTLHGMMDGCKQMGVELFVLDDGWFGNGKFARDDAKAGLGDWQTNTKKLPNGIDGLVKAADERGIKFGIWVEPEMVNPQSELYTKHPDWVVAMKDHPRREGRNQLVLDHSNPAVQDFIVDAMSDMLAKNPGITYVKWDCNKTITDPGSSYLGADRQKNLQVDYINGYYAVLDRLVKKHPAFIFQACGSGGGRADYGAMKYHHEFWTSDDTDPYDRVFIQWGHSFVFPANAMAAHVTESPSHQSKRVTPLKFRFDVAMSGRLGMELSPSRLKPEEIAWLNKAVVEYKRIRPVTQLGDLYRLADPYKGDISAVQFVKDENGAKHSVALAYLKEHRLISGYGPIVLQGLDPAKRYKITELNIESSKSIVAEHDKVLGGDALMSRGITVNWNHNALQSVAVELIEAPAGK
jgi:alpha-galactosidase